MLEQFFISKVRVKMLTLFLRNPSEKFYVRQIQRAISEEINAVRRELKRLQRIGLLRREVRGNRIYYQVKPGFPLYNELLGLVSKEVGLGRAILEHLGELGKIKYAFLSNAFARGRVAGPQDVDLMIVGKISLSVLKKLIATAEKERGHEINYTVMSEEEFDFRKKRKDRFINDILRQGRITLLGDEEEMVKGI